MDRTRGGKGFSTPMEGKELEGQEIIDFVAPHVAAFKKPKRVEIITA